MPLFPIHRATKTTPRRLPVGIRPAGRLETTGNRALFAPLHPKSQVFQLDSELYHRRSAMCHAIIRAISRGRGFRCRWLCIVSTRRLRKSFVITATSKHGLWHWTMSAFRITAASARDARSTKTTPFPVARAAFSSSGSNWKLFTFLKQNVTSTSGCATSALASVQTKVSSPPSTPKQGETIATRIGTALFDSAAGSGSSLMRTAQDGSRGGVSCGIEKHGLQNP